MFKKASLSVLLIGLLVALSGPSRAEAAEFMTGPTVTVGPDQVINDDLYASAGTIVVQGTINGDLIAAGGTINVQGTVNGDIIIAGGDLAISGAAQDDVRAAGGQLTVTSPIGGDLLFAGGTLTIGPDATLGQDLVVTAGDVRMAGTVMRNVMMGVGSARINGVVGGDVEGSVGEQLVLGPNARIEGDLDYQSVREADIEPGAQVLGQTTREVPTTSILGFEVQQSIWTSFVQQVVSQIRWFLGVALVGLLLLWIFPRFTSGAAITPAQSPWKTLGMGIAVLILAPIVVAIAATIALLVTGFASIPVLLVPGAIYFVLLSLTAPVIAILIGALILPGARRGEGFSGWKALLIGAAILAVIGLIPVLNTAVGILTILIGFGAWLLFLYRRYSEGRRAQTV